MIEPEYDPEEVYEYECFDCGEVVTAPSNPSCPECGAGMRNRRYPIE